MDKKVKIISMSGMPVSGKSTVIKSMIKKYEENGYLKENIHVFSVGKRFRDYFNKVIELAGNLDNEEVTNRLAQDKDMKRIFTNGQFRKQLETTITKLKQSGYSFEDYDIEKANNSEELAEIRAIVDNIVDNDMKELGEEILKENNENEVWIMDSRLAFSNIPESFAVRLTVRDDIAAKRLVNDDKRGKEDNNYKSVEEAKMKIQERKKGEEERYKEVYDIDLSNPDNYNLIIDTSYANIDEIADTIISEEKSYREQGYCANFWMSPKQILPTQKIGETLDRDGYGGGSIDSIKESIKQNGFDRRFWIETFEYEGRTYMIDGHHRLYALAETGNTLIPYYNMEMSEFEKRLRSREMTLDMLAIYKNCYKKKDSLGNLVLDDFDYEDIYPGIIEIATENYCEERYTKQWIRMLKEQGREKEYLDHIEKLKVMCGMKNKNIDELGERE